MGDMSPMLESFLAGQKGQLEILKTAHDLVNMQMERKQRQQEIDDIMKRFAVSSKFEQQRVDMEHQAATDTHNLHLINAEQQFRDNLNKGLISPQMNNDAGVTSIADTPQTELPNTNNPASPGLRPQFPIPGVSNIPTPATPQAIQTMDTPFGKVSVPMPKTQQQISVENAQALLPVQKQQEQTAADIRGQEAVKTFKETKEPMYQAQLAEKDRVSAQRDQEANARLTQQAMLTMMGFGNKAELVSMKEQYDRDKRRGFQTDAEYSTSINHNADGLMDGTLDPSLITLPEEKQDSIREVGRRGGVIPPKGMAQKVMDHVEKADKFLAAVPRLQQLIGDNGRAGQIANLIRTYNPLSDNASQFKSIVQPLTADLEGAQQISKARAGSSPNLIALQKDILPRLTDTQETLDRKVPQILNQFMSAASAEIASLPPESKKRFFQRVINEHPSLIDGDIGKHIVQAAHSGKWVNLSAR